MTTTAPAFTPRTVGKALLMPSLAVRLLRSPRSPGSGTVLLAQAFSYAGDLALNGRTRGRFLAGLSSFLLAHLAYIAAFRRRSSVPVLADPGRRRFVVAGGTLSTAMALAAARTDRTLAAPVAVYSLTLTAMVASAAAVDHDQGRDRLLTGASLFLVSDTLIGVRKFLAGDRGRLLEAGVLTTYAAAQWCIVEGMRAGSRRRA
ncbi:lysoplasmalogenase [Nocardioides sp. zg-DK7169]|uniref:lysoplasmalogenase n=1 Tax=Nocardioides sp. zg-DK7169 TaxID=2736600 RepID=UPI001555C5CA|nr:lysoplasmalogenase [Nocardioides sp. zg-DK7169]